MEVVTRLTSGKSKSERSEHGGFGDQSSQLWKKWGSDYHEKNKEDCFGPSEKDKVEVSDR